MHRCAYRGRQGQQAPRPGVCVVAHNVVQAVTQGGRHLGDGAVEDDPRCDGTNIHRLRRQ